MEEQEYDVARINIPRVRVHSCNDSDLLRPDDYTNLSTILNDSHGDLCINKKGAEYLKSAYRPSLIDSVDTHWVDYAKYKYQDAGKFVRHFGDKNLNILSYKDIFIFHMRDVPSTSLPPSDCPYIPNHKKLEFLHIPKTGGSTIELLGAAQNISWGTCHYMEMLHVIPGTVTKNLKCPDHPHRKHDYKSSIWHMPIHLLPEGAFEPYSESDVFCVIRNPYDRIVSEYNMNVKVDPGKFNNSVDALNKFVKNHLTQFVSEKNEVKSFDTHAYWMLNGHFIPQIDYTRDAKHILRFENIEKEFNCLMSQYGLNIHWPIRKNEHHPSKGSNAKLTKVDLTQENVELIKFVYKDDFDAFGYTMNTKE